MWPITFYWFSSRSTINTTFSFINNYPPHQQFVKNFIKQFVSLVLFNKFYERKKKKKYFSKGNLFGI